jgi:hypothetical protein
MAPPGRAAAQMAYDRVTRKVILFGGFSGRQYLGDTWLWDGNALRWTRAAPIHSPPAVTGPMVFTDPNGHVDDLAVSMATSTRQRCGSGTDRTGASCSLPNFRMLALSRRSALTRSGMKR